jgi:hypothetical protein
MTADSFVRVPSREWCVSEAAGVDQRVRLLGGMTYEEIVARLVKDAELVKHKCKPYDEDPLFLRAEVTLRVRASTADLFHNSLGGYRAAYSSVERGLHANAYALARIVPRVVDLLDRSQKRTCLGDRFEKSLLDEDAKVWIHQGAWWRQAKIVDRQLRIARWLEQESSPDKNRRKKARWASLIPDTETRIELKGGFLSPSGSPLGSLKPDRALDIHKLGFT